MKPRLSVLFACALICALILPGAAVADDGAPRQPLGVPSYHPTPHPPVTEPVLSGEESRSLTRPFVAQPAASPAVALGQPGLSFRYVATYGHTESAYIEDASHLNFPYGVGVDGDTVWIAEQRGNRVLQFKSDGTYLGQIGKAGMEDVGNGTLSWLSDVALDAEGNRWIVDSGAKHILKYAPSGELKSELGATWDGRCAADAPPDRFCWPVSLAFDAAGNIYVSDEGLHVVRILKPDGSLLARIGEPAHPGSSNSLLNLPEHIAISDARLYVADSANHRVQIFDISTPATPTYVATIGTTGVSGSDATHVAAPYGVAVNDSFIYVAESDGHRVSLWRRNSLAYNGALGEGWGTGPLQFKNPRDVAVDANRNVYVADWQNSRVQEFYLDLGWGLKRTFGVTGTPYVTDAYHYNAPMAVAGAPDGGTYLVEQAGNRLVKLDPGGNPLWVVGEPRTSADQCQNDAEHLCEPFGVAVDRSGRVYVADSSNQRIQVFTSGGSYYATLGTGWGQGNYQFSFPRNVYVAADGKVYVADQENERIQIYDSKLRYVATLGITGERGSDGSHLDTPVGVAVDSHGTIYVAEEPNHRVKVYGSDLVYHRSIGGGENCNGSFDTLCGPHQLAVDEADNLYISDSWHNRIQVFDAAGKYLTTIAGSWGTRTGQLRGAAGVAVAADGGVLVADTDNHRVQKYARGVPGWKQVNINGWGDRGGAVDSLAAFNGNLYAGSGMGIYRMTAAGEWSRMAPAGFGDQSNVGIDHMIEFKGQLYAGTWTWVCDDADCNTGHPTGGQVWRTANGTQWTKVADAGLGDPINAEVFRFVVFNDQLYAATWASSNTHGAEIWRSSTGNAGEWTRVVTKGFGDPNNTGVLSMAAHGNALYAGTTNSATGGEVWRSTNGSDWLKVNSGGFGEAANREVASLAPFGSKLYAGTYNRATGGQVWGCAKCDGSDWTRVVNDGFAHVGNRRIAALTSFNGALYAVTNNMEGDGMDVLRTTDFQTWPLVVPSGFGDSNNSGPYWGNSVTVANNHLYIGTANGANGAEVWATALTADFTATPTRGQPPLAVQFTNTSAGDYTTSLWDFGDGQPSAEKNPTHTYAQAGTYTVKLTVGDGTDSDTVTRSSVVRVGYSLYLPTVTRNWDPLMYDNFDDPQWNGAWNPAKWAANTTDTAFRQQAGVLVVTEPPSANPRGGTLYVRSPQYRSWQNAQRIEARLKASSDRTGSWSPVGIAVVADNINGHTWYATCRLGASADFSPASFACSIFTWQEGDNYPQEYETPGLPVDFDRWCTARIETDPNTGAIRFYLDNTLIGSHIPLDAPTLLTSKRVEVMITNWGVHANSSATRYVDDVRITPAK